MLPTIQQASETLIAVFEGEEHTAYEDPGGVWTIGIGHTEGVYQGMTCTHDQAMAWFAQDELSLFSLVTSKPILAAMAYLSFGFNCGSGALQKVLGGWDTVSNPVHTTDRQGNVLPGLVTRRNLEMLLIAISQG